LYANLQVRSTQTLRDRVNELFLIGPNNIGISMGTNLSELVDTIRSSRIEADTRNRAFANTYRNTPLTAEKNDLIKAQLQYEAFTPGMILTCFNAD